MEELLQQIVKEATGTKLMNLKNASQNAIGGCCSWIHFPLPSPKHLRPFGQTNCIASTAYIAIRPTSCEQSA